MKLRHINGGFNGSKTENDSGHNTKPNLLSMVRLVTHQCHIMLPKENFEL